MELKLQLIQQRKKSFFSFNRTFMELKWRMADVCDKDRQVSIVPLWNWNMTRAALSANGKGFNRTFMELKSLSNALNSSSKRSFQSYLYGIEITGRWTRRTPIECFNRTFMELKLFRYNHKAIGTWFQSYLYGIEIDYS